MFGYVKKENVKRAIDDELKIYTALLDSAAKDVREAARGVMTEEWYREMVDAIIRNRQQLFIHLYTDFADCGALKEACEMYNHWLVCSRTIRELMNKLPYRL